MSHPMINVADRSEQTGGAHRTPRSEITSIRKNLPGWEYEPAWALDGSPSMFWSAIDENDSSQEWPHPNSRRAIVAGFAPLFIGRLAKEDSMAAQEALKSGGDPDKAGGVFTVMFSDTARVVGDVNEANVQAKLADEQLWTGQGTHVVPAIKLLIQKYEEEFEEEEPGVHRVHEINITTDGEATDWEKLIPYLRAANDYRTYNIMIIGHGSKAKAAYDAYEKAAKDNQAADPHGRRHVNVALLDGVTDPVEVAGDAIAMSAGFTD